MRRDGRITVSDLALALASQVNLNLSPPNIFQVVCRRVGGRGMATGLRIAGAIASLPLIIGIVLTADLRPGAATACSGSPPKGNSAGCSNCYGLPASAIAGVSASLSVAT